MRLKPLTVRHIDGMCRDIINGRAGARRRRLDQRVENSLEDVAAVRSGRGQPSRAMRRCFAGPWFRRGARGPHRGWARRWAGSAPRLAHEPLRPARCRHRRRPSAPCRGRDDGVVGPPKSGDEIQEDHHIPSVLDQALCLFDHYLGDLHTRRRVTFCESVGRRGGSGTAFGVRVSGDAMDPWHLDGGTLTGVAAERSEANLGSDRRQRRYFKRSCVGRQ